MLSANICMSNTHQRSLEHFRIGSWVNIVVFFLQALFYKTIQKCIKTQFCHHIADTQGTQDMIINQLNTAVLNLKTLHIFTLMI